MDFKKFNNLFELFELQKNKFKSNEFLHSINNDKSINSLTWLNVSEKIESLANYLKEQKVEKGDRIMLVSEGRPEWMISDLAILANGAITVHILKKILNLF